MTAVWAFAKPGNAGAFVYESIKKGKSRFGWSWDDCHNLKKGWSDQHSKQMFLLQIKPGDWIVHVNCPDWGQCVAVPVIGEYGFDVGLQCNGETEFRHFIPVNGDEHVLFDRRNQNILPSVNLNPRKRYHRIYAVADFMLSLDNLRMNKIVLQNGETKEQHHLRKHTNDILTKITALVHETHKGKNLERLLAKVFERVPNAIRVENTFGWGSDYGADLIVWLRTSIGSIELENKVVVQIKSFAGEHYCLSAIDQIKQAIKTYEAIAGIIITTAEKTEQLENAVVDASEQVGKPIDLWAGNDVAKFILQHGRDVIFDLSMSS